MMYKEVFGVEGAKDENLFFRKYSIKRENQKNESNAAILKEKIEELEKLYCP